mgnify:FL=1
MNKMKLNFDGGVEIAKEQICVIKKHEYLILKLSDIPTIDDITHSAWSSDLLNGKFTDFRYNTEDALLMIIEVLTRGTQQEEIGKEISEKARAVFDYYADKD